MRLRVERRKDLGPEFGASRVWVGIRSQREGVWHSPLALGKARGLTQAGLAEALGATQAAISKYERGDLLLHGQLIAQLSAVLRVSADELLGVSRSRKAAVSLAPVVDKTLARRLAQLQQLPRRDREALLRTLDAFLGRAGPRAA